MDSMSNHSFTIVQLYMAYGSYWNVSLLMILDPIFQIIIMTTDNKIYNNQWILALQECEHRKEMILYVSNNGAYNAAWHSAVVDNSPWQFHNVRYKWYRGGELDSVEDGC